MAKDFSAWVYNSRRWKDIVRPQVLRRDHYTCAICGGRAEEVHHIQELTPDNITDDAIVFGMDNLQSLCRDCHQAETFSWGDTKQGFTFDERGHVVKVCSPPRAENKKG